MNCSHWFKGFNPTIRGVQDVWKRLSRFSFWWVLRLLQVIEVLELVHSVSMCTEEAKYYLTGVGSSNLTQIDFSGMELGDPFLILENLPSKVQQVCLNNVALHTQVENSETWRWWMRTGLGL
eukprot:TRINITY_DN6026_c0_g2_i1.p1 TRINITY_DN6026_c0_g2~~TRINITY_DN6026_c0_g2_i1.p1  ORF type:complete len:122 (-),score=26.14 TRINITY_DN6026_c0_g2_i1:42-407(-)